MLTYEGKQDGYVIVNLKWKWCVSCFTHLTENCTCSGTYEILFSTMKALGKKEKWVRPNPAKSTHVLESLS